MNFQTFQKYIALFVILFINFLFSVKYLSRYTDSFLIISILILLSQGILINYRGFFISLFQNLKINNLSLLLFFSIISIVGAYKTPMENLHIDRWSVITSFWDNYFNDLYAYKAQSFDGNYPGPMPFYFLIMLPFYLIREFSYITIIGIFILYFLLSTKKAKDSYSLFIISSIPILYEVLTRSNIFFNSTIIIFSLHYFLDKKRHNSIFNGIIIGLFLSTRNVFIIPYEIMFIYALRSKSYSFTELTKIGIVAVITFIITFLPFIYNHINEFWEINPFIIQSSVLMPTKFSFACIIASLLFSFLIKKKNDVYFLSGISLFLTIVCYLIYQIFITDFNIAFWDSQADITYFILCYPFLIYFFLLEDKNISQNI